MSKLLEHEDCVALLKHYEIDVSEGHRREGAAILISGGSTVEAERASLR
jgi:F0F1-type ATP synthase epsilon subunit